MGKLIGNANWLDPELPTLTKDVVNRRITCIKFNKPGSRPIVGPSKAHDLNQTVLVDLDELKPKLCYMHVVDEFTRYNAAADIYKNDHI